MQAGVVYFPNITTESGETLEYDFMASGRLWRDALVMMDRQTGSLWTQRDGRALQGESQGLKLEPVPSTRTVWSDARTRWPTAQVLRKKPGILGAGAKTMYERYLADPTVQGIFGTEITDDRLPPKALVYGYLDAAGQAHAVPVEQAEGDADLPPGVLQYWFS